MNNDNNKATNYKTHPGWSSSFVLIDDGDNDKGKQQQNSAITAIFIKCKFSIKKRAFNQNFTLFNCSVRNLG
jgi:hypothetical protein